MESRFAHLRQRDTSVDMLRVKMSRRRSQSQKENRDRAVNSRRQLAQLPEMESSTLEASINMSTVQEKAPTAAKQSKADRAIEERLKMLMRFKEKKALQKEKDKREKEKKGVFKVGLYRPQGLSAPAALPEVCPTSGNPKGTAGTVRNSRVTRSMKQAPQLQTAKTKVSVPRKVEPSVSRATRSRTAVVPAAPAAAVAARNRFAVVEPVPRALSTRSANRPPAVAVPVTREKPSADARSVRTRAKTQVTAPPKGNGRKCNGDAPQPATAKKVSQTGKTKPEASPRPGVPSPTATREEKAAEEEQAAEEKEEELAVDPAAVEPPAPPSASPSSFAPQGFTFQAPAGLSFKLAPLTPRSAEAFLTPSPIVHFPPVPLFSACPEGKSDLNAPSSPKSTCCFPALPSPLPGVPAQCSPLEPQHDVPYFRSEILSETSKLTGLCHLWEPRVEEEAIPEEMRDSIRTAVGQARLLMKERFGQFAGLVDDCELSRGEKITTCSDLQGFWDMVYYQVEDVYRKFAALTDSESKGWVEEQRPTLPRQKKLVKKPLPAAVTKPGGTSAAAAKSRLAAIKAAMRAKQQAAEKQSAQATGDGTAELQAQGAAPAPSPEKVVFHGGFFQVESPAKLPGSLRKSSRLSAHPSPASLTKNVTPGRGRRSVSACHASHFPRLSQTPDDRSPRPEARAGPLRQPPSSRASLCFSPVVKAPSMGREPGARPVDQSQAVAGRNAAAPDQSERVLAPEKAHGHETGVVAEPAEDREELDQSPARGKLQSHDHKPRERSFSRSVTACESESSGLDCVDGPDTSRPMSAPLDAQGEPHPGASLPLSPSSRLSAPPSPVRSPALSFSLSPCPCHTTPARPADAVPGLTVPSSPYLQAPAPAVVQPAPTGSAYDPEESMGVTPDTSMTEEVPGLDFERYLRPSARCSLSPRVTAAPETASPMATDVEMDSPVAQPRDLLGGEEEVLVTPSARPSAPRGLALQTPQVQPSALSDFLFFTPDPKDRLRQSVCPSDLMVFTPPSHK